MTETNNITIENTLPYKREFIINGLPILVTCLDKKTFDHEKRKAVMRRIYYENQEKRTADVHEYYVKN